MKNYFYCFLVLVLTTAAIEGFAPVQKRANVGGGSTQLCAESDPNEIVARRITVKGDVQGGYYRACVNNEAGKFRKLYGTMSPPDDSDVAEIYVEGKKRQVDGFVRWCKNGAKKVGLSQSASVEDVKEEDPTGLYDGFYVKTR